jgi:NAD-dependent dihydropyrimidine dehydrogenase PreA subunit
MAYVITQACIGTTDRSCVEVCPVDCFYYINKKEINKKYGKEPGKPGAWGMLVINPDECINCGACETECPVEAIYEDSEVPENMKEFIAFNEQETVPLSEDQLEVIRCTQK